MSIFNSNFTSYNIITENELSQVLSKYESEYVFTVIDYAIKSRFTEVPIISTKPNLVFVWEENFKTIQAYYGTESENMQTILNVKFDTYREIIKIICNEFNMNFTIDDNVDIYSAAFYLYDFFVCKFTENMINFYANFIYKERSSIFDALKFAELKKNKDSSTVYGKKIYKDIKLAIINANINSVIDYVSGLPIPFYSIISIIFGANSDYTNYILNIISDAGGDFFHNYYTSLMNTEIRSELITGIRIKLKDIAVSHDLTNNNSDLIIDNESENDE